MGRNTWESLPKSSRPLKNRLNIIISSTIQQGFLQKDTYAYNSFEEALELLNKYGNDFKEYTIIPRIYITNY